MQRRLLLAAVIGAFEPLAVDGNHLRPRLFNNIGNPTEETLLLSLLDSVAQTPVYRYLRAVSRCVSLKKFLAMTDGSQRRVQCLPIPSLPLALPGWQCTRCSGRHEQSLFTTGIFQGLKVGQPLLLDLVGVYSRLVCSWLSLALWRLGRGGETFSHQAISG